MRTIQGGLLIAIEGIDGAGKSTLARGLADELNKLGIEPLLTKEPTNGPHGTALRQSATTGRLSAEDELKLFVADRREHVEQLLRPALDAGRVVILDRYYFSNAAYQGAAGLDSAGILAQNEAFAPKPDLLLLLDLPPEIGLSRIAARGDRANAFENEANLTRCRGIFLRIDEAVRVDATQSAEAVLSESLAHVFAAVKKVTQARLGATVEADEATRRFLGAALAG
ncbi:dTMP kinase [Tahibacter sp.]|uniref:dTMP kinase n=1 Tax=Tahibacter sp. TaxID=2056211 RepID=UPI0028C40E6D|nr:dTMP kinase [Tahibacter sp.]